MLWGKKKNNNNNKQEEPKEEEQKYRKDEMFLWLDGTTALAAAIVKQWIEDGCEDTSEIVDIAMDLLKLYLEKHK